MAKPYKQSPSVRQNGMHHTTTNFEDLANAIILRAAEDYRIIYRQANILSGGKSTRAEVRELERFFRSDWFKVLTSIDGEFLIRELRKQAIEEAMKRYDS